MVSKSVPAPRLASVLLAMALPVAAADFLVSDFDDMKVDNALGSSWYTVTDADSHGNSSITTGDTTGGELMCDSSCFSAGHGATGYAYKLGFVFGDSLPHGDVPPDTAPYDPELGMATDVYDSTGNMPGNITGATGISFWAKADKNMAVRFIVSQNSILDYAFYGSDLAVTTAWKQFTITFSDTTKFKQPDWASAQVAFEPGVVSGFSFNISKGNNAFTGGNFYLDDFKVLGWTYRTTAIRPASRASRSGLTAVRQGNLLKVVLPGTYGNRAGTVQLVDASGHELARAGFAKGQRELSLKLEGKAAVAGRQLIRILPVR